MFESMDPYGESEVWASFVPPVPPDDDDVVEVGPDEDGVRPDPEWDGLLAEESAAALVEFEESLERVRLGGLDADAALAEAVGVRVAERRVQARLVVVAARWADLHATVSRPWVSTKGGERLVRLGGDGTPGVAEFAPAELGAVLGMSDNAAKSLVADAVDLRHRFPVLWQRVQAAEVDVWLARKVVQEARSLSREAAARVDARIAGVAGRLTWRRVKPIVGAAILAADPPKAGDDAEQAAARAGVFPEPETSHGYQQMVINAAAGDVQALDEAIELIARALKTLGDTRDLQPRRATAVGVIANPQAALDLIARAEQVRTARWDAAAARRAGDQETAEQVEATLPDGIPPEGRCGGRRPFAFTSAVLYLHLARESLEAVLAGEPYAAAGVVRVEDIGPVILDQVTQWLQHANVVLKPVINLPGLQPVDHYETPGWMSEAIGLQRSADSWPYATCTSRRQDNEHTIPYQPMDEGGPPGQTDPAKMSTMTRFHHRIKTFAGWTVHQARPGAWLYRSPHHYYFLVDQHGTTPLGKL